MNHINFQKDLYWLFNLKGKISSLLRKFKGKKRRGFYHYSLSGDFLGDRIKWGLGNSVFFLKIILTLGLEKEFEQEVKETINFILTFQRKDGSFYDPLIKFVSLPIRILKTIKTLNLSNLFYKHTKIAETRQTISVLSLLNVKPTFEYKRVPNTEQEIGKYLKKLDWSIPWSAGSHFSHLIFFLYHSSVHNKDLLINFAINWVNSLQHETDGFWYKGNPSIQLKINGAMKIFTAMKVVNKMNFKYPERIIDNILLAINDEQACDNFNIVYVLKYCNELTESKYRYTEIENFMYERLRIYKQYYHSNVGGFSFQRNQADKTYYSALISKGRNEPDLHGTHLFLWGISVIIQILKIDNELMYNEIIP